VRTAVGITVGTPIYMSPEQARGETLSPASDVYSFGLLLQTLFTGREPYAEDLTAREVMLKAARGDTQPVTGIDRDITALIGDLKSFAPTDRPTAADTLARLRRIADKPKRFARRIAAALLIVVFLAGIAKYTVDLRRERAAAVRAGAQAILAQREAATRRGQAEDLINFMLGDLRRKLEPIGKLDLLDDVGERALAYNGSLRPELMSGAELARNAKALSQLGEVRIAQGRLAEAPEIFARARKMAALAAAKDPSSPEAQLALMTAYYDDGEAAQLRGDLDAALRHWSLYLDTARRLTAAFPANADYRMEEAYAHANVGTLLMRQSRYGDARAHFEETLRIKRARLARDPLNLEWQADLANTINKVGVNLARTGDLQGARRHFEEQQRISQMLVSVSPEHAQWKQRLAISHAFLASVLVSLGALELAESESREELSIERSLSTTDDQNADWQRSLGQTMTRLAALQSWRGHPSASDAAFREAEQILERIVQRDPNRLSYKTALATARSRSAMSLLQRGQVARARAQWTRAWALLGTPGSDFGARHTAADVLLTGVAIARAANDHAKLRELSAGAQALLGAPPLASSQDPDLTALRARLLVSTGRREEAQPLIARLASAGYHQPDYEWTLRTD